MANSEPNAFKLEPATLSDVIPIAKIAVSASTSPRMTLEFGQCKPEDFLDWNIKAIQIAIEAISKHPEQAVALKVIDRESGEIAGYGVWGWGAQASEMIFQKKIDLPLPAGSNIALRKKFISSLLDLEHAYQPREGYFELLDLLTSPTFQRRGIGSQLVKVGLDKADREGKACFLSGSPMGVPVYRKLGFEDVGRLEIDMAEFGGEGVHVHVAMVRKPQETA